MTDFVKTVKSIGNAFAVIEKTSIDSVGDSIQNRVAEMINENIISETKSKHPVLPFNQWGMLGGSDRKSYDLHLNDAESKYKNLPAAHTTYSIRPITSKDGHPHGYQVMAWSPRAGHAHKFLGSVNHPAEGVKLARKHYDNLLAPKDNMQEDVHSIHEGDGTKTYSINGKTYQGFKTKEARDAEFKRRRDRGDELLRKAKLAHDDKKVTHPYLLTLESVNESLDRQDVIDTRKELVGEIKKHPDLHSMIGDKPDVDTEKYGDAGNHEHHVHDRKGNTMLSYNKDKKGMHRVVMSWRIPGSNTIGSSQVVHVSDELPVALKNAYDEFRRRTKTKNEECTLVELSTHTLRNYAQKAIYDYGRRNIEYDRKLSARRDAGRARHRDAEYDELKKLNHKLLNRFIGSTKAVAKLASRADMKKVQK